MPVWEVSNHLVNEVAMLVATDEDAGNYEFWEQFEGNGLPLHWDERPKLEVFMAGKAGNGPKPRADISPITAEGLAISARARDVLGDFLSRFGQFLELDVEGNVEYYYNVTNMIRCVDVERSLKRPSGTIKKPVFIDEAIPSTTSLFTDPSMWGSIYVNDTAKAELESLVDEGGISGMSFKRA